MALSVSAALANRKVIRSAGAGVHLASRALPGFTWWPFNCASISTRELLVVCGLGIVLW